MSIHSEHPFATPPEDRSPLRRFRGRLVAPVGVWTAGAGADRVGWTVSSFLVADGDPAEVVGVVDEESGLGELLAAGGSPALVVNLLGWPHRHLADAFAGLAPAPGGVFRLGEWTTSPWGPVLTGAAGWLGARAVAGAPGHAGWGLLVRATVEHVEVPDGPAEDLLTHVRGRYRAVDA